MFLSLLLEWEPWVFEGDQEKRELAVMERTLEVRGQENEPLKTWPSETAVVDSDCPYRKARVKEMASCELVEVVAYWDQVEVCQQVLHMDRA